MQHFNILKHVFFYYYYSLHKYLSIFKCNTRTFVVSHKSAIVAVHVNSHCFPVFYNCRHFNPLYVFGVEEV